MPNLYSDDRLRLAARLYYIDGLGQNEVAKFVKVSQAKVSRLLALARERGIVRITVADYEPRHTELEAQIRSRFGLGTVVVIKTVEGFTNTELRKAVGHFAADALNALIKPGDVVAIAGGRTIHELVHHLPEVRNKALTVVQAMGSVDSNVSAFDAQEVGRVVAQRLGGSFLALNAPAYIPEKRTRDTLLKLPQVRAVHDHLGRAQVAIVGVGTLENSVFVERGTLSPENIQELRDAGAVGEVCGRFFDKNGEECETDWRDQVMSAEAAQLRKIPQTIGVVSGNDRTAAISAAIRGRLINGLIIDETGAMTLLATPLPPARRKAK
ncbi:sugar-binding transcriptional regulator [Oleiharenicola sp. Vm1]|uniref:sugar-binding transcriptional regulator n=1 Tax=Oleiharenicola sp. Vm1 TaxID=3398393 RepID=UPI0039F4AE33